MAEEAVRLLCLTCSSGKHGICMLPPCVLDMCGYPSMCTYVLKPESGTDNGGSLHRTVWGSPA